jgi:AcrR family transcriptional regulator
MTDKTATRDRLIEAAIGIIETGGEAAVRVDVVTEQVGVTKPSLYHFFGDRDGLVTAAYAEMYRRSLLHGLREFHDAIVDAATPEEYRRIIESTVVSFGTAEGVRRRAIRASVIGSAVTRPTLQAAIVAVNREEAGLLARALEIGVKRGWSNLRHSPQATAYWWWGVVNGRHLIDIDDSLDAVAWDAVALDAVSRLLFGSPAP